MKRIIRTIAQKLYKRYRSYKAPHTTSAQSNKAPAPPQAPPKAPEPKDKVASLDIDIIPSPNPQACKYELSVHFTDEAFSFSSPPQGVSHTFAQEILSLDGVHSIFGFQNFITVKKHPSTTWTDLHPKIEDILKKSFGSLV